MKIFLDEEDNILFLQRIKENLFPEFIKEPKKKSDYRRKLLPPNSFDLITYCLMPNHFHLLIKQKTELPISKFVQKVITGYSKYFNKKYGRAGSVFQDKFKSVRVSKNEQLLWTSFYIHENPKKAELVKNLSEYRWSSYLDYAGSRAGILCKKDFIVKQFKKPELYLEYFSDRETNDDISNKLISCQNLLIDDELQKQQKQ